MEVQTQVKMPQASFFNWFSNHTPHPSNLFECFSTPSTHQNRPKPPCSACEDVSSVTLKGISKREELREMWGFNSSAGRAKDTPSLVEAGKKPKPMGKTGRKRGRDLYKTSQTLCFLSVSLFGFGAQWPNLGSSIPRAWFSPGSASSVVLHVAASTQQPQRLPTSQSFNQPPNHPVSGFSYTGPLRDLPTATFKCQGSPTKTNSASPKSIQKFFLLSHLPAPTWWRQP